jgi:hypothetical protein
MEAFALGTLSGLVVGLVGGWFAHILAGRRSKQDRRLTDETELLDRCGEVFNARVKYVIAFHRRDHYPERREEYLDVKRRFRWADPEVVLEGTPAWDEYMAAERTAKSDKDKVPKVPVDERVKNIEAASYVVVDALAKRRAEARK